MQNPGFASRADDGRDRVTVELREPSAVERLALAASEFVRLAPIVPNRPSVQGGVIKRSIPGGQTSLGFDVPFQSNRSGGSGKTLAFRGRRVPMQFGLYLKKKGVITAEQLVDALDEQHRNLSPLGQLAMEEGILSARDVFSVLRSQRGLPRERFGEVAVAIGMMRTPDLHRLLALQWTRKPPLGEVLVRRGIISRARVDDELAAYRRDMERRGAVVTRCIAPSPHRDTASSMIRSAEAEPEPMLA